MLADLASHLDQIRSELPTTASRVYLNTGTFGPLPQCTVQAMRERLQQELYEGRLPPSFLNREEIYHEARTRAARLLRADLSEIALTDSTSEGLNIICYGFNWLAGDEVITTNHEHPSALAPLYQIRKRFGITIRTADLGLRGERSLASTIEPLITNRTRLIVISHISFKTGTCFDIHAVASLARKHGIPVLVDGAQSAGVIPLDVQELDVDFYALPMQKWLCGPDGTGMIYMRKENNKKLDATYVRFFSLKDSREVWDFSDSARCLEWGGRQTAAVAGQVTSLRWLEEQIGYPWIYQRIAELHSYAFHALQRLPLVTILTPEPGCSGLLTFRLANTDPETTVEYLRSTHAIHLRTIKDRQALRISTGFFNTEAEIDALVEALQML